MKLKIYVWKASWIVWCVPRGLSFSTLARKSSSPRVKNELLQQLGGKRNERRSESELAALLAVAARLGRGECTGFEERRHTINNRQLSEQQSVNATWWVIFPSTMAQIARKKRRASIYPNVISVGGTCVGCWMALLCAGTHSPLINQFASDAKSELFAFFCSVPSDKGRVPMTLPYHVVFFQSLVCVSHKTLKLFLFLVPSESKAKSE